MWNNLRARHYSVLILLAIVALETSAIAIDRLVFKESEEAFSIESSFQNNQFIQSFRMADASYSVLPVRINDLVTAHENKSPKITKDSKETAPEEKANTVEPTFSKTLSANLVEASSNENQINFVEYSVQPGDSLSNIAEMFGSKMESIKLANNIDNSNIKAGQNIKVPLQSNSMSYTVKKGDSLSRIASKFNVSIEKLIKENNLKTHVLMADQKIKIPVENRANLVIAKVEEKPANVLPIVKTDKPKKVEEPRKLQMVKLDNKLSIAQAASSVKKTNISFSKEDILNAPAPVIAKKLEDKKENDSVELNLGKTMRKSLVAIPELKKDNKANAFTENTVLTKANDTDNIEKHALSFSYKVAKGDSLSKIASKFNTTVAQIQTDNNIEGDKVKIGQSLKIVPNKKLYRLVKNKKVAKAEVNPKTLVDHKVQNGESLSLIAKKYNTTVSDIVNTNNLTNTIIMSGQTLKVPENKKKNYKITRVTSKNSEEVYAWRTPTKGWVSSRYGWRKHPIKNRRIFHAGLDLAAPKGTAIYNVAPGRVIYAGTMNGYGKLVIISHENGISTRYGHCSQILVKNGQFVKEGQLIAKVGATGVATGNHLHFEVRKNGQTQNPLNYLKNKKL